MDKPLAGRRALVTGASAGIGAATARALARAGAELWLVARRADKLQALAAELGRAHALALDICDAPAVAQRLAALEIDILIDNAGLALGVDKLSQGDPAEWSRVIDTNVKGVLNVTRALLPGMLARGRGDVLLLGSVAGRQVYAGGGVYCASKHAVRAIYEALRLEHVGSGVRFSTVDPGMVGFTEFSQIRMRGDEAKARAVYQGVDPLRPEDVAEAILWVLTRPAHVNVGELVLWASAQASTTSLARRPG
jgi:3-hydroxy acid dehydrogenase / malonic semialdehyde reductase